ncbi:hypothetical protein ACS3L2_000587 [Serratia marcescens]|uniref:hypothetical protein n=1 Tax=Serratia marcescens TaxID=615 RepID=UPI00317246DC|nr:hypothetical protein [Serratia marcescens]
MKKYEFRIDDLRRAAHFLFGKNFCFLPEIEEYGKLKNKYPNGVPTQFKRGKGQRLDHVIAQYQIQVASGDWYKDFEILLTNNNRQVKISFPWQVWVQFGTILKQASARK